jgi:hypothetical protein
MMRKVKQGWQRLAVGHLDFGRLINSESSRVESISLGSLLPAHLLLSWKSKSIRKPTLISSKKGCAIAAAAVVLLVGSNCSSWSSKSIASGEALGSSCGVGGSRMSCQTLHKKCRRSRARKGRDSGGRATTRTLNSPCSTQSP